MLKYKRVWFYSVPLKLQVSISQMQANKQVTVLMYAKTNNYDVPMQHLPLFKDIPISLLNCYISN